MENKNSILIIDDEKANISALKTLLNADYKIYAAKNGRDGIETAEEFTPDIILLDVIMPDMDGYEVIAELKKSEKTWNIPVIFITGLDNLGDEEKGLNLGAADYIPKPFSPSIVKLRIKNQIDMINQLRTINRISVTDQLTGIKNRRGFDEYMNREWGRTIREKLPISFLILDADNFKNYNDTYGHQQGDIALQTIANILKTSLRRVTDIAARWGGEEFVVLLPNTDKNGIMEVAEKIRSEIEKTPIPLLSGELTVITVSVGVNTLVPAPETELRDFIDKTDEALYTAKRTGKNKVVHVSDV
ncbi:MAG: diguanylate cyclase [Oscillospiraceae bacterium]|nr:diguanylate cyclase [Oscillospiraceae bacterium]